MMKKLVEMACGTQSWRFIAPVVVSVVGCGGTTPMAHFASGETGCPEENIAISGVQRSGDSASYYAECGSGALYECTSSGRYVDGITTSCSLLEGAEEESDGLTEEDVQIVLARELVLPPSRSFTPDDGSWTAQAPALRPPVVEPVDNGIAHARLQLAPEVDADCFFYPDSLDTGAAVSRAISGLKKNRRFEQVGVYGVSQVDGYPLVLVDSVYVAEESGRSIVGSVKIGLSPRHDTPVVCLLDAPGYRKSFSQFMRELLSGFETQDRAKQPAFMEIVRSDLGGSPTGFVSTYFFNEANGVHSELVVSAQLLPAAPGEFLAQDAVQFQTFDQNGLVSGSYAAAENGRPSYEIEVSRKNGRRYVSRGSFADKPLDVTFLAQDRLASTRSFYEFFLDHAGEGGSAAGLTYAPDIDPQSPVSIRYDLDGDGAAYEARIAELHLHGKRGENGLPRQETIPIGGRALNMKVIRRSGKF